MWVDANVLIRFLTGEPPEMADRAERLLGRARRDGLTLRIHPVVVAETVWVLQSFYGRTSAEVVGVLVPLLTQHGLRVEGVGVVVRALELMSEKNVDFADALLAETALSRGESVASFDADFRKLGAPWHEPT
ncbi:PIN domain-containing protein [Rubrobacter marinus]|uniref:Ribonuclease VapC n=1 Tax=Rubrobacter marinus TaxID=2653852 RepID=A0A6G8Q2E1_9ACTN|nr:PIN domain-containing protein [Rubrobacter marinus]